MIIQPNLLDHPKYLRLERLVGVRALHCLLRLWAHCQDNQKGSTWVGVDDVYVELVCRWDGAEGALVKALEVCQFVRRSGEDLHVLNWDEYNASLIRNWYVGPMGGRPKKAKKQNPEETQRKPSGNPRVSVEEPNGNPEGTHSEPLANPVETEKRREEKRREEESSAREVADAPEGAETPNPEVPTQGETLEEASLRGIPAEFAQDWHDRKTAGRYWFNNRGELIAWKFDLRAQWTKRRHTWKPPAPSADTVEQLEVRLAAIPLTDTARREAAITALLDAKERARR